LYPSCSIESVGIAQQVPMVTPEMITCRRAERWTIASNARRKLGSS